MELSYLMLSEHFYFSLRLALFLVLFSFDIFKYKVPITREERTSLYEIKMAMGLH